MLCTGNPVDAPVEGYRTAANAANAAPAETAQQAGKPKSGRPYMCAPTHQTACTPPDSQGAMAAAAPTAPRMRKLGSDASIASSASAAVAAPPATSSSGEEPGGAARPQPITVPDTTLLLHSIAEGSHAAHTPALSTTSDSDSKQAAATTTSYAGASTTISLLTPLAGDRSVMGRSTAKARSMRAAAARRRLRELKRLAHWVAHRDAIMYVVVCGREGEGATLSHLCGCGECS